MQSDDIDRLTGSDIPYNYREIIERCDEKEIVNYINRTKSLLIILLNHMTIKLMQNGWLVAIYL